jgi:hypothetical protein
MQVGPALVSIDFFSPFPVSSFVTISKLGEVKTTFERQAEQLEASLIASI